MQGQYNTVLKFNSNKMGTVRFTFSSKPEKVVADGIIKWMYTSGDLNKPKRR
jgi:hypothetical protein